MPIQVLMPQLGESVTEGTITKWLKAQGEAVNEYDPLVEVNTDKVDTEIPSPAAGFLGDILIPEGAVAKAGALLAWIVQPGESAALPVPPGQAGSPASPASPELIPPGAPAASAARRDLGLISPVVATLAAEHSLDLAQVPGRGLGGRNTKKDVQDYLAQTGAGEAAPTPPARPQESLPPAARPSSPVIPPAQPAAPPLPGSATRLIPHTPIRRRIAEHMVLSKHTSPHVTTVMEVDLSRVAAHRQANKPGFARDGVNLTYTAYFVAAIVEALKAYPVVNSSWSDEGLLVHGEINIGMATSLGEEGLIVPVIKAADSLSLLGLARTINDLSARARAHKLQPDEVKSGTFTLTNHGISGSLFATPVINQPQCGILGVGAIQKRPVVISDESLGDVIAIRTMVYVSLTFVHRILDGATADWFLAKVVKSLQSW